MQTKFLLSSVCIKTYFKVKNSIFKTKTLRTERISLTDVFFFNADTVLKPTADLYKDSL